MKKRNLLLLFALLFGALFMVACGGEEAADETTNEETNEETHDDDDMSHSDDSGGEGHSEGDDHDDDKMADDMDPAGCNIDAVSDGTEVTLLGWSFPIMDFYAEEVAKCDAVENLDVNVQLLDSAAAKDQARLALSSGGDSPYDIVHGANGEVADWGSAGWLMPLNDLIDQYRDEYDLDDIPAKAWEGATYEGNIYGVPVVGNTLHLIYRSDILEAAGLDVPDTYDDVIAMCNAVGLDNPDYDMPFTVNLSAGWAWEIEFFQMQRAFGGDFLDENSMPTITDEASVNAVNKLVEIADACMGEAGYSFSLDDQEVAVQQGTLPATNMWASRSANMHNPDNTDLADVIAFAPAPRATADGPRAGSAWNDFYMIPATTTNDAELIFKMIMEAADAESQARAAEIGIASRTSAAAFGGAYQPAVVQTIAEGIGIYDKNPAVAVMRSKLGEFLPLVGTGEMTAEEVLQAISDAYIEEATAQGFIE